MTRVKLISFYLFFLIYLGSVFSMSSFGQSDSLFYQSVQAIASGDSQSAILLLEEVENRTLAENYNLGLAYAKQERWTEALWAFESVLKLCPNHEDARHNAQFSLQQINGSMVWSHPFSWAERIFVQMRPLGWFLLGLFCSISLGLILVLIALKKVKQTQLSILRTLLVIIFVLGVFFVIIGVKTERYYSAFHHVLPVSNNVSTFASKEGVELETLLRIGQRYEYLSDNEDWIQIRFSDQRPVWVKKEDVRWY
jgi:hypothetical protein